MAKAIKFKNNIYLDSTGIVHNKIKLNEVLDDINEVIKDIEADIVSINTYLNGLVKVVDYATTKTEMWEGNRYRGNITLTLPSGYQIISIIPCYTGYGDRNFVDFNLYYDIPRIYYEVYCQYGHGDSINTNFRVVLIKK